MKLRDIAQTTEAVLTAKVEFRDGMVFTIRHLTGSAFRAISTNSKQTKWNPDKRQREDSLDAEKLTGALADAIIVDWSGVTLQKLRSGLLLKVDAVPADSWNTDIPYDPEEARFLLANLRGLDEFLLTVAQDPAVFNQTPDSTLEATAKNS